MKWFLFILTPLFLLCACSLEQYQAEDSIITINSFKAELDDSSTKVHFVDASGALWWDTEDQIAVFSDIQDAELFDNENRVGYGEAGSVFSGPSVSGNEFYAYYPVWNTNQSQESRYKRLWYLYNSFADPDTYMNVPMVAKYQDGRFRFKQTCGLIHIRIKGKHSLKAIMLGGNSGELITGWGEVDLKSDEPSFVITGTEDEFTAFQFLWYEPSEPMALKEDEVFNVYFAVPPMTFTNGFQLIFNYLESDQVLTVIKSVERPVTTYRGKISSFPVLDIEELIYGGQSGPDGPDIPEGNIDFRDPVAKYACVEKFDIDGDGELSYREAALVTSIEGLFADWAGVSYFDELQYFINVTSTEGVFEGLKNLKAITIPANIVTLGSFSGCSALTEVHLPDGMKTIPDWTFWKCTSLSTIEFPSDLETIGGNSFVGDVSLTNLTFPETLKQIGEGAFYECTGLRELSFPEGITINGSFMYCSGLESIHLSDNSILYSAFNYCTSLSSIIIPKGSELWGGFYGCNGLKTVVINDGVKAIGEYTFYACTSLEEIDIPDGVTVAGASTFARCLALRRIHLPDGMTSLPNYFFDRCTSLSDFNLPETITAIGDYVFDGCDLTDPVSGLSCIDLPANIRALGSHPFGNIRHIILRSPQLVTIESNTFDLGSSRMYVPSEKLAMYKARTNWSYFSDYIFAIDDYPSVAPLAIDLGLPSGLLWSDLNVGASFTDESGDYFAWGEVSPKSEYTKENYKWSSGTIYIDGWSYMGITKYNLDEAFGPVDGKTVLEPDDDAATVNLGAPWRMPTDAEYAELFSNCSVNRDGSRAGISGLELTSKTNGKILFLPATGASEGNQNGGHYWSSSYESGNQAGYLYFNWFSAQLGVPLILYLPGNDFGSQTRHIGCAVRPVRAF